jgi:hypothetical protein
LAALVSVLMLSKTPRAFAEISVPPKLQAQLIARIASFDRNFRQRAQGHARLLLVAKPGSADSARVVNAVSSALGMLEDVGGLSKSIEVVEYRSPAELAETTRTKRAAILYLSVGLETEAPEIAKALAGADVLTIGATGTLADQGANVGFDLLGGRPKIVINLATCRAQHVELTAQLLKLAHVIRE